MIKSIFNKENKQLFTAVSIIAGTCIGAGFLGIPYVAAKAGFFVAVAYIILFAGLTLLINLYLGEIILRTKGNHQLTGYAKKYLGKKGKTIMLFATKFAIYSAIVAYILGVSESISFLVFGNVKNYLLIGILFGIVMSLFIWKGTSSLKKFEKIGVIIALVLLFSISIIFFDNINMENLLRVDFGKVFLPFGVILFSMMSFFSIPEAKIVLKNNKKLMKKAIIWGTLIPAIFYLVFTFIVVGFKGNETPEISTLALGNIFILIGIITMFTSYLSLGNALQYNFLFDFHMSKRKAWFEAAIIPIFIFLISQMFDGFFSFIRILSIGGIVSGGTISILVLIMHKRAKKFGKCKPEFKIPVNKWVVGALSIIFIFGVFAELFKIY